MIFRILASATMLLACFWCAPVFATQRPLQAPTQSSVRYGSASFRIKVPAAPRPRATRGLRPLYLSPSTKSFAISTDGLAPVVTNVNPSTGYATVTIRRLTVGTHRFTVTAYDRPGAAGTILSTGNSGPIDVPAGYVYVSLTLSGVVAALALALDYPNPTLGSPAVINLNVTAKDADGNVILSGAGKSAQPFTRPFTLTTSDAANGKLSQTTLQESLGGNDGLRLSVAYSGANVPKIVFSATGGGLAPQAFTPATLVPIAPPTSGEQLLVGQLPGPLLALSTLGGHQLLGTIGTGSISEGEYGFTTVDFRTRLIYADLPDQRIEIRASSGAYQLVDSIATPGINLGSLAIDSTGGKLFSARGAFPPGFNGIAVYSTAAGHALLAKIPYLGVGTPNLAVDAIAGRLYAAGCPEFGCGTGIEVFSTAAPYELLGAYGDPYGPSYCSIAVDSVSERLFLSECNLPNENPSYVDVYEAADLQHRAARIGPLTPAARLAIDAKARVLYVTAGFENGGAATIDSYALDAGYLKLGSFPVGSAGLITIAPYAP